MGNWESVQFLPEVKFHDEFAIFFLALASKTKFHIASFSKMENRSPHSKKSGGFSTKRESTACA